MTEEELIELRDSLVSLNTELDTLDSRVTALENLAVPKGTYFNQLIESFQDSPTCDEGIYTSDPVDYLEIVAGTDTVYLGVEFGGYITARNFIISAAHPHTAYADEASGVVIQIVQIKPTLVEAVIGTITFVAGNPVFTWATPDVAVLVGDVLRFKVTAHVPECQHLEVTLVGRFPRYILE